jgi:hypothetical protein
MTPFRTLSAALPAIRAIGFIALFAALVGLA